MPLFLKKACCLLINNLKIKVFAMRIHCLPMVIAILLSSSIVFAHEAKTQKSVEEIINSILSEQKANNTSQVDCTKISSLKFEELGDALMERMAGSHELHE